MELKDVARRLPDEIRAVFESGGMGRQWSQALQELRVPPRHSICTGYGNSVGDDPQRVPLVQDMLEPFQRVARPRRFPRGLAHTGRTIRISPRRLDRIALRYLGWVQLAACVIFIRAVFFR